ncbi:MAG: insulinase family protein [Deltaproteobacteria bacterium]|nr:MAG: insulinase family protein [Deltaproteobacteria bacterium]
MGQVRHLLDNGLKVLVQENHASRAVALQAWVDVGSADERDEEAGLAHVHEHMLFKGTERRGVGEIAREVEAAGGDINAWTSFDQTVYHLVLPSRDLEVGLDILADVLQHSAFDPEELRREQEVILEEIRRTYDSPARRAARELFDLAYVKHPYRRPVIGYEETVRGFTRDDVLAFYRRHYRPDNVTLVAVGDFDEEALLPSVEAYFGGWARREAAPRRRPAEPPQEALRVRRVCDGVREGYLELGWHVPEVCHDDIAALDLLSVILGQGESARLNRWVTRRGITNDAVGYLYAARDPGLFIVSAQAPLARLGEAYAALLEVVFRVCSEEVEEAELEKAKNIIESEAVYQRETVQGMARKLGFYETVTGSAAFEDAYYRRVRQVAAPELLRVAQRYLQVAKLSAVALAPESAGLDEAEMERLANAHARAGAAKAAPARTHAPPPIESFELPGGTTLLVQPDHSVPVVALRAVWKGGLRAETEENAGLHALMARLLSRGTEGRSAEEIAEALDTWAASLSGVSGRNSYGLGAELLSRHFEAGFELFAECLDAPAFPKEEFEVERARQIEELKAKEDHAAAVAFDLFHQTYWRRHPYRMDVRGSEASLAEMTPQLLRDFHHAHYRPSSLTLAVVGDVEPGHVVERAEALFGRAGPSAALPEPELEAPPEAPRRAERTLEKAQAHIVLGYPGVSLSDPDRHALEVLANVLGGQSGRLFVDLRDRRSLAYTVSAMSIEALDPGYFALYIACAPEKIDEAIAGLREHVARVREEAIGAEELEGAKRNLSGLHEIGLQRMSARAAAVAFDTCYGLGPTAHRHYAEAIGAVDAATVREVAERYLRPESEVLALVHP